MVITTDITKKDLFLLSLYLIPRLRGNWIFLGVLALVIFAFSFFTRSPMTGEQLLVAATASLGAALGGVLSVLVINLVTMLLKVDPDSAVLGRHYYSLTEQGLETRNAGGEMVIGWDAISSIARLPGYMLFRMKAGRFHLIPARSFNSGTTFKAFLERAQLLKRTGRNRAT